MPVVAQRDGLRVVGDSAVNFALLMVSLAPLVVAVEIRVDLDGLGVVRDGAINVTLLLVCAAPVGVGIWIVGIDLNDLVGARNGAVVLAFAFVGVPPSVIG